MKKSSSNTRLLPPKPEKKLNKSNSGVTFKQTDLKMSKEIPKVELPEAPKPIKHTPPVNDAKDSVPNNTLFNTFRTSVNSEDPRFILTKANYVFNHIFEVRVMLCYIFLQF